MAGGVKDLKVWQESVSLAADVLRAIRPAVKRETMSFTNGLIDAATEVPVGISSGYAAAGADDQRTAYDAARSALLELETRLTIARQAGLIQAPTLIQLSGRIGIVGRLLTGYVGFLDRQADRGRVAVEETIVVTAPDR